MRTKEFEKIVKEEMKKISFTNKKVFFVKKIDENTYGTIGFGIAHNTNSTLLINPRIGVFYKQIEDLYFNLTGNNTSSLYQPVISTSIGYLMPENSYKEWEYSFDNDLKLTNENLLNTIIKYGLPFIEKYSNEDNLLQCLIERKYILNVNRDYKLPILYFLRGEKQKAIEVIESSIERQKKPFDKSTLTKFEDTIEQIDIICNYGQVDSAYLAFVEKFKKL